MICCRDMRAIIKNVECSDEYKEKYVVVKAVADDNMLWYYGRYPTPERAMEVARDITYDGVVGFMVIDDMIQTRDIKMSIGCTEEFIEKNALKEADKMRCKSYGFDQIKEIVNGTGIHKTS